MPALSEPRDPVEALYREVVLAHYRNPRNREPLPLPTGEALVSNPVCGDQVKVEVELADGRISRASARARGCSIAVAAASVMTELVTGLTADDVARLRAAFERVVSGESADPALDERLRAFARVAELPSRQRCATLGWEALVEAVGRSAPR